MKKTISTILALVMLATPLVGTACFANEPAYNAGAYVQNQDRSERFKFDKKTVVKAGKIASCIAAGTAAVVGATVAGLKIFEDFVPGRLKENFPFLFKNDEQNLTDQGVCYIESTAMKDDTNIATSQLKMPSANDSGSPRGLNVKLDNETSSKSDFCIIDNDEEKCLVCGYVGDSYFKKLSRKCRNA